MINVEQALVISQQLQRKGVENVKVIANFFSFLVPWFQMSQLNDT